MSTSKVSLLKAADILTSRDKHGVIGCGGYGTVRLCKDSNLEKVAVKCFSLEGSASNLQEKQNTLIAEAKKLQKVEHENIIKVHGVTLWPNSAGIVTEYASGGNLGDLLNKASDKNLPWILRLRIAIELAEAIAALHNYKSQKALIHGDIKPKNVLLSKDLTVKLADFGSVSVAVFTGASTVSVDVSKNKQRTAFYTAPEFLKNPSLPSTPAMDVYSYGMVLYEILTRTKIFTIRAIHSDVILQVICDRAQRPDMSSFEEIKSGLSGADLEIFVLLEKLMKNCWAQDPRNRPEIGEVLQTLKQQMAKTSKKEIKRAAVTLVGQLGIKSQNFDNDIATTLDNFTFPFEIAICTDIQNQVPESTMTDQSAVDVSTQLESIKKLLRDGKKSTAASQCDKLFSCSQSNVVGDYDVILNDLIAIAYSFIRHSCFERSVAIMEWGLGLCKGFTEAHEKLDKLRECGDVVYTAAQAMHKHQLFAMIKKCALPFCKQLHDRVKLVSTVDEKRKAQVETWCLFYISCCHGNMGNHRLSEEAVNAGISLMKYAFGGEANKQEVFAQCYYLSARAKQFMGKDSEAVKLYKDSINMMEAAVDISPEAKRDNIKYIKNTLKSHDKRNAVSAKYSLFTPSCLKSQ